MLEDIAVLTGGRLISEDLGIKLENIKLEDLGKPNASLSTRKTPRLSKAMAKKADIQGRVARSVVRLKRRPAITIARNCRSAWRNSPAALQSSTSALRLRPR
jgi:hypothetical protein